MTDLHGNRKFPLSQPPTHYRLRYYFIIAILLLVTLSLVWRLVDLTIIKRAYLQGQGNARTLRTVEIPAYRGMILDRNGKPLAISTPVDSVWVNPKEFLSAPHDVNSLASLLNIPAHELLHHINAAKKREFLYLKRDINPEIGASIKALKIPGVYLQKEFRRYYPEGEVTAQLLGFTNIDDQGQEGLELGYNQYLQGAPGLMRILQDRMGHIVANMGVLKAPQPGHNLQLSIDRRIQYFAYRELKKGIDKYKAESGSIIVLDVRTGEILAMANWPSYNPNNRPSAESGSYRNRAVTDLFEPGSSIKPFSMASALTSGKYRFNSTVDTSPGWIMVSGHKIDDDGKNNGVIDMTTVLKVSSNVGMSKITLSLPPENLWQMLNSVGFGQLTSSGFPGERAGLLENHPVWNPFVLGTLSFGYGISVTLLQLAQAYQILAEDGVIHPVTFLKIQSPSESTQIINSNVASELLVMMESILEQGGTAPEARVPGYRVTGKTGTAHMVGAHGYEKNHYNGDFIGIAPASHPRLLVAVVLHNLPGTLYFGGYTAGPIFSRVMEESLRLLNIPPDDLKTLNAKPEVVAQPPPGMVD
jgi:cell division protein FtsI (penicillin-binding protein 3)